MRRWRARIGRVSGLCGVLLAAVPGMVHGQRTRDQTRLSIGLASSTRVAAASSGRSYLWLPTVTGATVRQGLEPSTRRRGVHLFNFTAGVDVVLERKRGRAY